jgi:hypothetical protein
MGGKEQENIVGNYSGQVQFAEGYHTDGKFYNIVTTEEATLDDVTTCTCLTLKIQVQKCNLIWGVYEYYNSLESEMEVDNFSGVRIDDNTWQIRDGEEVITLVFSKCNKKVNFSLNSGNSTTHERYPGYFELIDGCLKKCKTDCC